MILARLESEFLALAAFLLTTFILCLPQFLICLVFLKRRFYRSCPLVYKSSFNLRWSAPLFISTVFVFIYSSVFFGIALIDIEIGGILVMAFHFLFFLAGLGYVGGVYLPERIYRDRAAPTKGQ